MRLVRNILLASVVTVAGATSTCSVDTAAQSCSADDTPSQIRCFLDAGSYGDAERIADAWLQSVDRTRGRTSLDAARASDYLVDALIKVGKGSSPATLELAEGTVRTKQSALAQTDPDLAVSLENLAAVYTDRGEFARAVPLHRRALAIRDRALPTSDALLADTLDGLAHSLILLERLQEARTILGRSSFIRQQRNGISLASARTLSLRALLEKYEGNYTAGLALIDEALRVQRRLAPDHPDIAAALQLRGEFLLLSGDVRAADVAWTTALDATNRTLGSEHPLVPLLLRELAFSASASGDLAKAHELLERALPLGLRVLAPCHQEIPAALDDLASLLGYDGDYTRARTLFGQALSIRQRCLGPNHSLTATVVHNQALLAADMGDLMEAQRLHEQALRMWSTGLGSNHPFVARALDALADTVASRGNLAQARALYARSLSIKRKTLGDAHPDVASTLTNMARLAAAAGDLAGASSRVNEALAIYRHGGLPQEPDHLASALDLQGAIEQRRGQFDAARATYTEALALRQRMFGADHPLVAESQANTAVASFALGAPNAALRDALAAEQTGRDHLRFTIRYLPERQAMAYAAARPRGLDLALSIGAVDHSLDPASVLDAVIRSRAVILDELAARAQSASTSADPQLASLNRSLIAARQRFATLMLRSLQGEEAVPTRLLDEARQQKEDAERALAERSATAREEAARAQAGLDDVRRGLPPDSALVSFVRYDRTSIVTRASRRIVTTTPSYIALVARADNSDVKIVPLGTASSIERLIDAWRSQAGGGAIAAGVASRETERTYRAAAIALRLRIWDPLAGAIAGATRVFIVPDGALNLVSFAALPVGNRYLLEAGPAIHYLSTERDLVRNDPMSGHGLLALGGPAFDVRVSNSPAAVRRSGDCATIGALRFEDLPGSRAEIQDIAKIWGSPDDVLTLSGRAATKTALTQAIVGRKVVHLATHGFFLGSGCEPTMPRTRGVGGVVSATPVPTDNPLLLAGLALAGVNTLSRTSQANGILNAEEIAGLNLQGTEWAVLSACDTGLGQITAGEGVFGLRRALQIAGVRTVIMSLWSVEDRSTRDWMKALYEARLTQQLDTPDSVRAASVHVLEDRRKRGMSTHPFYWAAFVAAGDWR